MKSSQSQQPVDMIDVFDVLNPATEIVRNSDVAGHSNLLDLARLSYSLERYKQFSPDYVLSMVRGAIGELTSLVEERGVVDMTVSDIFLRNCRDPFHPNPVLKKKMTEKAKEVMGVLRAQVPVLEKLATEKK